MKKEEILKHPRNKFITYDETKHTYHYTTSDQKIQFQGITTFISSFGKPFDKESISKFIAWRDNRTQEDVLQEWDNLREYGNEVHASVQNLINDGVYEERIEVDNFIKLIDFYKLKPLLSEYVIYDEKVKMASPIDVLCVNENNELVVIDIKTMRNGFKFNSKTNLGYPLSHLPDSNFYKYNIQVNFYVNWLERLYNFKVANTHYLLHLHQDIAKMYPVFILQDEVNELLKIAK